MKVTMKEKIVLLGKGNLIPENELAKHAYRAMKWNVKWKRGLNEEFFRKHMRETELIFHPLWVAKLLVIAARSPFPPKKTPMMGFVDAVSGYRGLLSAMPHMTEFEADPDKIVSPVIHSEKVTKYIQDIQQKQINRQYLLKKPKHQIVELCLLYLPLWKVNVQSNQLQEIIYINANTGESEDYMSKQWKTEKWLKNII